MCAATLLIDINNALAVLLCAAMCYARAEQDPGRSKRARWAASSPLRRCGASSPSCCAALKPTGG
jgi:hypothetical protein